MRVELRDFKPVDYHVNEAYKTLMTNVRFCGSDNKVIAVTSCGPNEGKSTVALNLAVTLAESGKKVMLIDADLRKSVLLGKIKVGRKVKGLSHFLSGQDEIGEVINETNIQRLNIILVGPTPPNPPELLGNNRFKALIQGIRKVYDYVIIDTPPVGSVIDGAIVADECDGAIMVIESKAVSYKYARKVKEQVEKSGCSLLGVVLNKVDISNHKYYGKYHSEYKHA